MKKILIPIVLLTNIVFASKYNLSSGESCFGYEKVPVSTKDGRCVGMVMDSGMGPIKPRKVIQVSKKVFVLTDMVSWNKGQGIVWKLEITDSKPILTKVFENLNLPHGLKIGPDGLIYVGESNRIFRFSISSPKESREEVISNLPSDSKHPISEFIFTKDNRLLINIGAPSDQCLNSKGKAQYPCPESKSQALIREYIFNEDGTFSEIGNLAYGLRNSMGLVQLESGSIIQFNNGMDFKEEDTPLEEVNLIVPGAHYGWPYCYENGKLNKKYKRSFFNRKVPKINCSIYQEPIGLLPAHSAPLDALLYNGEMFNELKGKILVSLHGYRKNGQRIIAMGVNEQIKSNSSFEEVIFGWNAVNGIRPKGAPVGLEVGELGEIYFVDDKNQTLMVLAKGSASSDDEISTEKEISNYQLDQFEIVQKNILKKHCIACHGNFDGSALDVAKFLVNSNLVVAKKAFESDLYLRVTGQGSNMKMPPVGKDVLSKKDLEALKNWINSLQ